MKHELEKGIKPGDLVWFDNGSQRDLGIFLKLQTFDKKYTCAMVHFHDIQKVRPVQANLITKVTNANR